MQNISSAQQNSLLAQAAYADWVIGTSNSDYIESLKSRGMTQGLVMEISSARQNALTAQAA